LIFLNICHLWSFVALSTPSLWAAVSFPFSHPNRTKSARKYFEIWLGRAGDHPLSLRVSLLWFFAGIPVDAGLKRHAHQIQSLELSFFGFVTSKLHAIRTPFPSLKKLTVSVRLESDCISGFIAILGDSPLLVECEFEHRDAGVQSRVAPESLTHLSLQYLRLDGDSARILQHLTLPVLESLTIITKVPPISGADLHSFLARSSPPLRFLDISGGREICDVAYLGLVPSLTDLVFDCWSSLELVPGHQIILLPNLRNLVIHSGSACLLRRLTTPILESLIIECPDISVEDVISFFARYSAPLQSLDLGGVCGYHATHLGLVPSLKDLTLTLGFVGHDHELLFMQWMVFQDLLPNLRSLTISCYYPTDALYVDLIELLKTRSASRQCTQLQSVAMIFRVLELEGIEFEGMDVAPNDDIIAALRQFVEEGVHIHVGQKSHNYI
jgi:hypothetical protein